MGPRSATGTGDHRRTPHCASLPRPHWLLPALLASSCWPRLCSSERRVSLLFWGQLIPSMEQRVVGLLEWEPGEVSLSSQLSVTLRPRPSPSPSLGLCSLIWEKRQEPWASLWFLEPHYPLAITPLPATLVLLDTALVQLLPGPDLCTVTCFSVC